MNTISRYCLVGLSGFTIAVFAAASLHAQAPANDDFANRQSIPAGLDDTVTGTTVGATQEAFEVVNGGGSTSGSARNETQTVWYDWIPTVSGAVDITLPDYTSQGQTYVLIFKGGSIPTVADIFTEGYLPGDLMYDLLPPRRFEVTAGQEYTISLGNTDYPGSFTLELKTTPSAIQPAPVAPVATVAARVSQTLRGTGVPGKFLVTLSSAPTADLTLSYRLAGTAVAGIDYKALSGSVTVPAGKLTAIVKVKALAGSDAGSVVVKLKLTSGDGYTVGTPAAAKVKIVGDP